MKSAIKIKSFGIIDQIKIDKVPEHGCNSESYHQQGEVTLEKRNERNFNLKKPNDVGNNEIPHNSSFRCVGFELYSWIHCILIYIGING